MSPYPTTVIDQPERATKAIFDLATGQRRTLQTALGEIFPEKQEETLIVLTRRIMGDAIADLSDDELRIFITKFQYLIDCWLDEFEREVFDGLTLKQLLMEG